MSAGKRKRICMAFLLVLILYSSFLSIFRFPAEVKAETSNFTPSSQSNPAYYGSSSGSNSWSDPSSATTEFDATGYSQLQTDNGDEASTSATAKALTFGSKRYANVAHRFTFNVSGYLIENFTVRWNGYYQYSGSGSYQVEVAKLMIKNQSSNTWIEIDILSQSEQWINYTVTSDIDDYISGDGVIEFGCILVGKAQYLGTTSSITVTLYTDVAQLEVAVLSLAVTNVSPANNTISEADGSLVFSAYWQSQQASLDSYIFSYSVNGAWINETYSFPAGVTEAWSNITKPSDWYDGEWIHWKIYANNTNGNWAVTEERVVFNWEDMIPPSRYIDGLNLIRGNSHIYYNGAKPVIYVTYINTSFWPEPMYQVRCFDLEAQEWVGPFNISAAPQADIHYLPSISVLPDGRLIILYSYYTPLKFRISTYSADTESNLTKLCSNWGKEYSVQARYSPNCFCYPDPVRFDDRLLVFGRDGTSASANWAYFRWADNDYVYSYVASYDNTTYTGEWEFNGTSPYVDELYKVNNGSIKCNVAGSIGKFTFRKGWAETVSDVYLEILCEKTGSYVGAKIYTNLNTTRLSPNEGSPTWLLWKLTGKTWNDTLIISTEGIDKIGSTKIIIYSVRLKLKIKGFSPAHAFLYTDESMYMTARKFDDKVIVYGIKYVFKQGLYNLHFVYSDDKGLTWKLVNGTQIDMPINLEDIKIIDKGSGNYSVIGAGCIIYENKPIFMSALRTYYIKNWTSTLEISYYNTTLGNNGSWYTVNATLENGNPLEVWESHFPSILMLDSYYNRPSIWYSDRDKILKLVALPNNFTKFRVVYTDSGFLSTEGAFNLIQDSPEAYEVAGPNCKLILGYLQVGEYDQEMVTGTAYGCKFTAKQSGYFTSCRLYQSPYNPAETEYIDIKVAIYDSNYNLLATSTQTTWVSGATFYGWGYEITFPNPPYLIENETYWAVWKVNAGAGTVRYSYTTGETNQTMHFPNGFNEAFPSQINISQATFYDRKVSFYGGEIRLVVRGLGHDPYSTIASNIGVSGELKPENTVTFHAFWTDQSYLDYAVFYWNASGSLSQNGTLDWADDPVQAWSNFTRVLPDQYGITIAWYIVAYDIYGNSGNTSIQYLHLSINLTVDLGETLHFSGGGGYSRALLLSFSGDTYSSALIVRRVGLCIKISDSAIISENGLAFKEFMLLLTETAAFTGSMHVWRERLIVMMDACSATDMNSKHGEAYGFHGGCEA